LEIVTFLVVGRQAAKANISHLLFILITVCGMHSSVYDATKATKVEEVVACFENGAFNRMEEFKKFVNMIVFTKLL